MGKIFSKYNQKTTVERILKHKQYCAPRVFIDINALLKMQQYCNQCDDEIGWLGLVKVDNANSPDVSTRTYTIYDTLLCKQNVTAVTTDLHEGGLQDIAEEFISRGEIDKLNDLRCWGHSHVNMQVSPSGTDESTFADFYTTCDYFIRIIANKKGDLKLDIVLCDAELRFDNVEWQISYPSDMAKIMDEIEILTKEYDARIATIDGMINGIKDSITASIKSEIAAKVTKNTPVVKGYSSNNWQFNTKTNRYEKTSTKEEEQIEMFDFMQYPVDVYDCHKNGKPTFSEVEVDDVLDINDIEELASMTFAEAKPLVKKYSEFRHYNDDQIKVLLNQCEKWYYDVMYGYGSYGYAV